MPADRHAHSLHAYFLRPGSATHPIVYQVDPIRDGGSFTTRRVVAIQHGKAIFSMAASFQLDEDGFEHAAPLPTDVPGPEGLPSEVELARKIADKIPESFRAKAVCDKPIEIRPVNPMDPFNPQPRPAQKYMWLKAAGELPDDPAVHKYLLAYASDFGLVGTSLLPHGQTFFRPGLQVASIDHSMWFHRDFRMDDWVLHAMESTSTSHARGLNRGMIYTKDGTLVASAAQEGLIRKRG